MRVVFDTNIILDVLLARQPFAPLSAMLVGQVERKNLTGLLCATTITTIDFLVARQIGSSGAREAIAGLLDTFEIAPVTRAVLENALRSSFRDFEDAVLNEAARQAGADTIVTRNAGDFRTSTLKIYTPAQLSVLLDGETGESRTQT